MTSPSTSSFPSDNNGGRDDPDVVSQIALPDDVNITQLMSSMVERLESVDKTDWLLRPSAGRESCCIFKVPQLLVEVNSKHYHPHIVSIGPYHRGCQHLEMMQQHKWRYLRDLLVRTPSTGPKLADYLQVVALDEEKIRECYSETLTCLSKIELVEMMVLDGLFIIEVFSRFEYFEENLDDTIFSSEWILPHSGGCVFLKIKLAPQRLRLLRPLRPTCPENQRGRTRGRPTISKGSLRLLPWLPRGRATPMTPLWIRHWPQLRLDFLRLENQIPFFVLQQLFDMSKPSREDTYPCPPLGKAALKFFNYVVQQRSDKVLERYFYVGGVHLLDLFHSIFTTGIRDPPRENPSQSVELIGTVKKLHQAGIKLKKSKATNFLCIRFCNGVLEIPHIIVDDYSIHVLLNFVAFEQCYIDCDKHIITYAAFMNCLICRPADATYLSEKNIIENYLGSDEELTQFFNNMSKDVGFGVIGSYLQQVFKDVNEHCDNVWNVRWAGFMLKYFRSPWSFMSASAVLKALLLTVIQTVLSIFQFNGPQERRGG
ncbi:UPF0481 protein At3g47200-like [Malus domestica]|uniref:UPF0481 protein At3g47200-like n=1 Tax=Malus domestica TaxID=3750 RepID=UPI0039749564